MVPVLRFSGLSTCAASQILLKKGSDAFRLVPAGVGCVALILCHRSAVADNKGFVDAHPAFVLR